MVIGNYLDLDQEVKLGGMRRDVVSPPGVNLSHLGAIPKKNKPGKWCLIMDLSSPAGSSVNDNMYIAWVVICLLCVYWSLIMPSSRSRLRLSLSRQTSRRHTGCCPGWLKPIGSSMGGWALHWWSSPIWAPFSSENFLCSSWCSAVDPDKKGASKICFTTSMTSYLFPSQGKSLLLINTSCSLGSSPRTLKIRRASHMFNIFRYQDSR